MTSSIITIGDELLSGMTVDTNSSWLGIQLEKYNIDVIKTISIGDNCDAIQQTIESIINENHDFIFITGGLGPTHDDVTKNAIKTILNTNEYIDNNYLIQLKNKYKKAGIEFLKSNINQAVMLSNTTTLDNHIGSALGIYFKVNNTDLFVMPGVPKEMKNMFNNVIVPKYFTKYESKHYSITLLTSGIYESKISEILEEYINKYKHTIKFSFLPSYKGVKIRLKLQNNNFELLNRVASTITEKLGKYIYGRDDDTLVTLLGNFIFTKIGNLFFGLNITDILYTYVLGKTKKVMMLNIKFKYFRFCIELPIKAK